MTGGSEGSRRCPIRPHAHAPSRTGADVLSREHFSPDSGFYRLPASRSAPFGCVSIGHWTGLVHRVGPKNVKISGAA